MKVGDLIQTAKGWSYEGYTGVIIKMDASEDWVQVLWTQADPIDGQTYWAPIRKLELISESR